MCLFNKLYGRGIAMLALGLALTGIAPVPALAAHDNPGPEVPAELKLGNLTCAQLMPGIEGLVEFKINSPADGVFPDGPANFTIDVRQTSLGDVFDWWISGGRVLGIFVKGGENGNLYDYLANNVQVPHDDGLHSPTNPKNNRYYGLSHISFCYLPGEPKVEISKTCAPPPTFDPDTNLVHTVFNVVVSNTGFGTIYDVTIAEDASIFNDPVLDTAGSQCSLTAIAGNPVGPTSLLVKDSAPTPVKVANDLAQGATLNLTVECDSSRTQLHNIITAIASSSAGGQLNVPLATHQTTAAEECGLVLQTGLTVAKACKTVRMIGGVVPQVCVDITLTNTSQQHLQITKLEDVESVGQTVDLLTEFINANGGDTLQEAGDVNASKTFEHCYTPTASGTDPLDPANVSYADQATAAGVGVFDGAATGDAQSNIASCPLCPPPPPH